MPFMVLTSPRTQGSSIGGYDLLIVVTGNLRKFDRIDGLRCEDWEATA